MMAIVRPLTISTLLVLLAACSGDGAPAGTSVDGVDACALLTTADVRTLVEANPKAFLDRFDDPSETEIVSVKGPEKVPNFDCSWPVETIDYSDQRRCMEDAKRLSGKTPPKSACPASEATVNFRVNVGNKEPGPGWCIGGFYKGVCLSWGMKDTSVEYVVPDSVATAVRARIDEHAG